MNKSLVIFGILLLVGGVCLVSVVPGMLGATVPASTQRTAYQTPAAGDVVELQATQAAYNQAVLATQAAQSESNLVRVAEAGFSSNVAIVTADKAAEAIPSFCWPIAIVAVCVVIVWLTRGKK